MKSSWLVTISACAYRLLLISYPRPFRKRFGEEMIQVFDTSCSQAYQQNGRLGLAKIWRTALVDWAMTVPIEQWAELKTSLFPRFRATFTEPLKGAMIMQRQTVIESHPFTERLATVLEKEPLYYQLLVSPQPTHRMGDVIDSLALEGDPAHPEVTLSLFQSLGIELPEAEMDRWLTRLREVAERIYQSSKPDIGTELTNQLLRLIMANPHLYELIAATEPGYGLLEIIESLALEADVDDMEDMLELMYQLVQR